MPNPFKESSLFETANGSGSIYGQIFPSLHPAGTNPGPYEIAPLPVAELEMEDPLSAEYRYYDEPLAQDKGDESDRLRKTRPLPVNL
ncbi:hypothetical protein N7450_003696 [Penicillium hetheringtonii]|uniref:Uncharacterized protein n=1 Tax=Penicillium hetheringtonii TaxID=911720 RepID=A0AAD6GVN9_9EURO|nr:hypothetical protein N7450_003696 [Penicillium hetheringtonii]